MPDRLWDMTHIIHSLNKGRVTESLSDYQNSAVPRILIKGMMVACRSVFFTLAPWRIQEVCATLRNA